MVQFLSIFLLSSFSIFIIYSRPRLVGRLRTPFSSQYKGPFALLSRTGHQKITILRNFHFDQSVPGENELHLTSQKFGVKSPA